MQFIEQFDPQDAVEQMLISQMILTHARATFLTRNSAIQKNVQYFELFHTAADRATSSFHKQITALLQYRRPLKKRRASNSFTTIRTAHINTQQVVTLPKLPDGLPKTRRKKANQTTVEEAPPPGDSIP